MLLFALKFLFISFLTVGPLFIWSCADIPDVLSFAYSGLGLLIAPILYRLFILRPFLEVSFSKQSSDLETAQMQTPNFTRVQNWYRLRVKNRGLVTLDSPRISCVAMSIAQGSTFPFPITPFELPWSEGNRDIQIGSIVPGNFLYRFDLGYIDIAKVQRGILGPPIRNQFVVSRRDQQERILLDQDLTYNICLIIANDNILVPAHYVHVQVHMQKPNATTLPYQIPCHISVVDQGDFWIAKILHKFKAFKN